MIHLGVYGCGNRTKALLASLRLDKFYSVAALYDIRREAALSLQQEYGGVICHTPEELISTPGIDAFIISLSPFAHADALRKTFKAEKPIFIEKPVSFSPKEIYNLVWKESPLTGNDNTVAVHIRHLREKIEINPNDPRYIKVIFGQGYKMEKGRSI